MDVRLKTDHGTYVTAEENGGAQRAHVAGRPRGLATATRSQAGGWETFELVKAGDDRVALKTSDGYFGCAEDDGKAGYVVFNRTVLGPWETFRLRKHDDGRYSLETCRRGYYLSAQPDGRLEVRPPYADGRPIDTPGGYERFIIEGLSGAGSGGGAGSARAIDPAWGHVRMQDAEVFADARGPLVPVGLHGGELFSLFCRGMVTEVTEELTRAGQAGFNLVRVWDNLGYYDEAWRGREVAFARFTNKSGGVVEATPHYYERKAQFMDLAAAHGVRVLWSSGDTNSMTVEAIERHMQRAKEVYASRPHCLFGRELLNEKWQNAPRSLALNEEACTNLMRGVFGGTGWVIMNSAPAPGVDGFDEWGEMGAGFASMVRNWFSSANVHGTREWHDVEKVLRRHFNYGYERYPEPYTGARYGQMSTEPGGRGRLIHGPNDLDISAVVAMHIATVLGRSGTVFMTEPGVFWDPSRIFNQPGFAEVGSLVSWFDSNAHTFTSLHGGRSGKWVTSAGGFVTEVGQGYARVDQLVSDTHGKGYALAHSGKGSRKLTFTRSLKVEVFTRGLAPQGELLVSAGQTVDVGGDAALRMQVR